VNEEQLRLAEADRGELPWRRWGPYLSERAWGTVREDYSADGDAWGYFPFEHSGCRTYRWNEDGMAGLCDAEQILCLALTVWNGADEIPKERHFGLGGPEGNHGEDVKEYWWYLDATPTSSWLVWRYHYPQRPFPYEDLRRTNRSRSRLEPEYELVDTGIFDDDRYWSITVTWAKAAPEDICWKIEAENVGPEAARLELLPTVWFRNRWSWGDGLKRPRIRSAGAEALALEAPEIGAWRLVWQPGAVALFCENETNVAKLYGQPGPPFPKDGIADHLLRGAQTVNPAGEGSKAAVRHVLEVGPGAKAEVRLRFYKPGEGARSTPSAPEGDLKDGFEQTLAARQGEADRFYGELFGSAGDELAHVARQAAAGMLWSKQFYHYDVARWLEGDPGQPPPPAGRGQIRNGSWTHLDNRDVISMPDPWEYPWYASWDLAFHAVALARLDPAFAKRQLILLGREWYMHPSGQLPAYEWDFGDVNPPVHARAALSVALIEAEAKAARGEDPTPDYEFLERIFHKLLLNFTWWVNRKDQTGNNVFEGGFLGLDNIGLFDRSNPPPFAKRLEQSDGTAWMATFCLGMLEMALLLARHDRVYEDVATKFFEHFMYIARAMDSQNLWDDQDGFFYDVIVTDEGDQIPVRVRSMVGVVALFGVCVLDPKVSEELPDFSRRMNWFLDNKPAYARHCSHVRVPGESDKLLLSVVDPSRLARVLERCLDPEEMLSDFGVRSLSKYHKDHPFSLELGGQNCSVDYEPAESTNYLFGGNSNWRGPIWFPLNYLLVDSLKRYHLYLGESFEVEFPKGSGMKADLARVAEGLTDRLLSIFLPNAEGHRPVFGNYERLRSDPRWRDLIMFHEYFHGDTGAGLGASHQTGWTGLVLDLIAARALKAKGVGHCAGPAKG